HFAFSSPTDLATTAAPSPPGGRTRRTRPTTQGTRPVYKLLLCVRYLQTRYLAFICIVSVMLGVATLIVVNAVMSGFSTKLKDRLHGVLSDVVVDTDATNGFEVPDDNPDPNKRKLLTPQQIMDKIRHGPAGDKIESITPTIETF